MKIGSDLLRLGRVQDTNKEFVNDYEVDPERAFDVVKEGALGGPFDIQKSTGCGSCVRIKTKQPPFKSECDCDTDFDDIDNPKESLESTALQAGLPVEIAEAFDSVGVNAPFKILLTRYPDDNNRFLTFYYIKNVPLENDFIVDTTRLFPDNADRVEAFPEQLRDITVVIERCAAACLPRSQAVV